MVTIGNADPVLALVRAQLERMAKARRGAASARSGRTERAAASARGGLQSLANLADLPEETFERALIGALLTREFGEDVAADARFQSVIDRTAELLRGDDGLARMVADVRRELLAVK